MKAPLHRQLLLTADLNPRAALCFEPHVALLVGRDEISDQLILKHESIEHLRQDPRAPHHNSVSSTSFDCVELSAEAHLLAHQIVESFPDHLYPMHFEFYRAGAQSVVALWRAKFATMTLV